MIRQIRHGLIAGLVAGAILAGFAPASFAVRPDEMLSDPALEARAEAISRDIRCVVCQSQSIEESDADIAHDLRVLIREQLKAGATDDQVRAFLVARYGDFVLLKPPFEAKTALIWIGPFLLLLGAAAGIYVFYRRVGRRETAPLNAAEQARLDSFLQAHDDHPDDRSQGGAA
ncbi:MAG TPA: cytochrome c-type biogenesis protein [Dongiaceae bacterium]|nr:cytochrome c-type biogenesis protein [Dongiaceae bacterium]